MMGREYGYLTGNTSIRLYFYDNSLGNLFWFFRYILFGIEPVPILIFLQQIRSRTNVDIIYFFI